MKQWWQQTIGRGLMLALITVGLLGGMFWWLNSQQQQQRQTGSAHLSPTVYCDRHQPSSSPQTTSSRWFTIRWFEHGCAATTLPNVITALGSLSYTRDILQQRGAPVSPRVTKVVYTDNPLFDGRATSAEGIDSIIELRTHLSRSDTKTTAAHEYAHVVQTQWPTPIPDWAAEAQAVGVSMVVYPNSKQMNSLIDQLLDNAQGFPQWTADGGYLRGPFLAWLFAKYGLGLWTDWMDRQVRRCPNTQQPDCGNSINVALDEELRQRDTTFRQQVSLWADEITLNTALRENIVNNFALLNTPVD